MKKQHDCEHALVPSPIHRQSRIPLFEVTRPDWTIN